MRELSFQTCKILSMWLYNKAELAHLIYFRNKCRHLDNERNIGESQNQMLPLFFKNLLRAKRHLANENLAFVLKAS